MSISHEEEENFLRSISTALGPLAVEVQGQVQETYSEFPTWVLMAPGSSVQRMYDLYYEISRAFREAHQDWHFSVSFRELVGNIIVTREVVEWDQLSESWEVCRMGDDMGSEPVGEDSVFETVRRLANKSA